MTKVLHFESLLEYGTRDKFHFCDFGYAVVGKERPGDAEIVCKSVFYSKEVAEFYANLANDNEPEFGKWFQVIPTNILGSVDFTNIDMIDCYAAFVSSGEAFYSVERIKAPENVLYYTIKTLKYIYYYALSEQDAIKGIKEFINGN